MTEGKEHQGQQNMLQLTVSVSLDRRRVNIFKMLHTIYPHTYSHSGSRVLTSIRGTENRFQRLVQYQSWPW